MSSISPFTDVIRIESECAGKALEVSVAAPLPGAADSPSRLLYVLDPMLNAALAIDLARAMGRDRHPIAPLTIVNVGTPIQSHGDYVSYMFRTRNGLLVPPEEGINDSIMANVPRQPAAEADRFLGFIAEELDPLLRSRYELAAEPAGLFGHSYGALCAAYALAEQLPTFDRYILSSTGALPDRAMLKRLCDARPGSLTGRVFLGLGEFEDACAEEYEGDLGVTWHRLCEALAPARQPGIALRTGLQAGHGHGTAAYINLAHGLQWLYGSSETSPSAHHPVEKTS